MMTTNRMRKRIWFHPHNIHPGARIFSAQFFLSDIGTVVCAAMWTYALLFVIILALVVGNRAIAFAAVIAGILMCGHHYARGHLKLPWPDDSDSEGFVDAADISNPLNQHIFMTPPHHPHVSYDPPPPVSDEEAAHQKLGKEILARNDEMLQRAYNGADAVFSADDRIMAKSLINGRKQKEAQDIRSHMNNPNWKKYLENELGYFDQEHRDWWTRDDVELSAKHVVF